MAGRAGGTRCHCDRPIGPASPGGPRSRARRWPWPCEPVVSAALAACGIAALSDPPHPGLSTGAALGSALGQGQESALGQHWAQHWAQHWLSTGLSTGAAERGAPGPRRVLRLLQQLSERDRVDARLLDAHATLLAGLQIVGAEPCLKLRTALSSPANHYARAITPRDPAHFRGRYLAAWHPATHALVFRALRAAVSPAMGAGAPHRAVHSIELQAGRHERVSVNQHCALRECAGLDFSRPAKVLNRWPRTVLWEQLRQLGAPESASSPSPLISARYASPSPSD